MDKRLTALIVDDEPAAVKVLSDLLNATEQFSDIRSALSVESAIGKLSHFDPDMIFLDIEMPEEDGFGLFRQIMGHPIHSEIILVTGHQEYAMEAIRNHAFGYLLKPVDRTELDRVIRDFPGRKHRPDHSDRMEKFLQEYEREKARLRFNSRAGYIFVDPSQILYCLADGNYTNIQLSERHHVCSLQLGDVEEILSSPGFIRLGRSLIINFRFISHVDRKTGKLTFEKDGKQFSIMVKKAQLRELERKQF